MSVMIGQASTNESDTFLFAHVHFLLLHQALMYVNNCLILSLVCSNSILGVPKRHKADDSF